jgi:hypothetical protein
MNITNISSNALKNLIKLTQRKEGLLNEIQKIESQLASLITGKPARTTGKRRGRPAKAKKAGRPAKAAKATKARSSAKRAPRGQIKKKILTALKAAGEAGMKVTDLSKKIGVKNANVHVWFSSTGKKLPEIKRVGKGHFKLVEKKA